MKLGILIAVIVAVLMFVNILPAQTSVKVRVNAGYAPPPPAVAPPARMPVGPAPQVVYVQTSEPEYARAGLAHRLACLTSKLRHALKAMVQVRPLHRVVVRVTSR